MSTKKVFITIGIALSIFLITLPLISYRLLKEAVEAAVFNHLVTVRELLKGQIEGYFQDRFGDVDVLARNPVTGQGFSRLSKAFHASGLNGPQYMKIAELYQPLMEHYLTDYGYVNIYFVDKDGDVMFSAKIWPILNCLNLPVSTLVPVNSSLIAENITSPSLSTKYKFT